MPPFFETTIDVKAPPARVWSVLADVERWHEWTASITSVRVRGGPALAAGARAEVRQPGLARAVYEVTVWDPPRSFVWITRSPGVRVVASHTVAPQADGARVTLSVDFEGALAFVARALFGGKTRRFVQMEAEGLKRRAESSAG